MIYQQEHIAQMYVALKWMTRRWSEKVPVHKLYKRYHVGQLYSVQPGRGKPGLPDMKIKITRKWIETTDRYETANKLILLGVHYLTGIELLNIPISVVDARVEGGYGPETFETVFVNYHPTS